MSMLASSFFRVRVRLKASDLFQWLPNKFSPASNRIEMFTNVKMTSVSPVHKCSIKISDG
jgi:hypothetical protein